MKKTTILFLLFIFGISSAQSDTDFSGYGVVLPVYQNANQSLVGTENDLLLDLTRLRLRPTLYVGSNGRLSLEYEINSLYQNGPALLIRTEDKTNRQAFDWRWRPIEEEHFIVTHFIDRLYYRQDFHFGNIEIGRQRVAWGTGRIWNPTDLFNPINPASFEKIEKDGADLITTQIYLGIFTDLTLVYNPRGSLRKNNAAFRFRSNYREYDVAVIGGYFDRRAVIGGDFAGNLFTAGFRGEGIVSANKDDLSDNFVKFILGLDYQFTPELYALVEYQHNGEGASNKRNYDLPRLLRGEIINLAQNYLFLQTNIQLHPLLNSTIAYNGNLDDRSGFILAMATYSLRSNLDLSLGGQVFYGNRFDEYWYYPNSFFLQGQFYF